MYSKLGTVLVVDDEPSVADVLHEDLIEAGYDCIRAATGEDALERLSRGSCDVMLLDLRLPGISGMDVLRKMQTDYPETAVIVVTALGDVKTIVEAMKIGAVDYITKPFELEKVNNSIELALKAKVIWSRESASGEECVEFHDEDADWTYCLDNIAEGVQTRLDSLTGYVMSFAVVEKTVSIARSLDIPEDRIDKWADRKRKDIERVKILDRFVEKG